MAAQFSPGEYVCYASNGVCLIDHIEPQQGKEFFILKPVFRLGDTIFVPSDNPSLLSKMRPLPTAGEIDRLLLSLRDREATWIDDRKVRTAAFQSVLKQCDLPELLEMVRCLDQRSQSLAARGKKLSSSDEATLHRAEGLIDNVLSFVLEIDKKQVGAYIRKVLCAPEEG